jgi:DNA primase
MNEEIFLLTLVSVNFHLYPQLRSALEIREIEDPFAKELFVVLEECFIHDERGMEDILARISSETLRKFVAEKGLSKEFSGDPEQLLTGSVKALKKRRLQRRLFEIISELRSAGSKNAAPEAGETRIDDLLSEKMYLDAQIRELEGR